MDKFGGLMKKKNKEKGFSEYDYVEVSKRVSDAGTIQIAAARGREGGFSFNEQFRKLLPPTKWAAEFNVAVLTVPPRSGSEWGETEK
ncbi:unnamed protein product [Eruca vesicaria subsp. sativa]|uniref:Uncharacterized protein n=1 Tax=Eruca vesicaria subsp. sativa TaxID=29727 RepID=A0ABC8KC96_ERUVS|nr:unnamed protein product [Eruca vesicaria subsp. sativa]